MDYWYAIERGKRLPSLAVPIMLSRALGPDPRELLDGVLKRMHYGYGAPPVFQRVAREFSAESERKFERLLAMVRGKRSEFIDYEPEPLVSLPAFIAWKSTHQPTPRRACPTESRDLRSLVGDKEHSLAAFDPFPDREGHRLLPLHVFQGRDRHRPQRPEHLARCRDPKTVVQPFPARSASGPLWTLR